MRLLTFAAATALLVLAGCSSSSIDHAGSISQNAAGRYIVGLNPGESVSAVSGPLLNVPDQAYSHVLNGFAGYLTANEVASLHGDPRVSFVEPDLTVEALKPPGGGGGGGGGGGQTLPWGVDKIDAELNTGRGAGVAVAIFDTGINQTHPDLAGAIIATYNATGTGSVEDLNGHGTHCAGIVGARDNSIGYVGVAPDCKIVAVKVLGNNGSGQISWIVGGIDWAVAHRNDFSAPIKVGSMSLGAQGSSSALATAITNATAAGITFAVAAGNSSANASGYIPASYSNVITVSALDPDNTWAYYSNYGNPPVDLIAPGTSVPSLWKAGGYNTISGTSMATPHVAGCIALWLDNNYDNDPNNDHATDFSTILSSLQSAGTTTWTGDPSDGYHEPLVNAGNL